MMLDHGTEMKELSMSLPHDGAAPRRIFSLILTYTPQGIIIIIIIKIIPSSGNWGSGRLSNVSTSVRAWVSEPKTLVYCLALQNISSQKSENRGPLKSIVLLDPKRPREKERERVWRKSFQEEITAWINYECVFSETLRSPVWLVLVITRISSIVWVPPSKDQVTLKFLRWLLKIPSSKNTQLPASAILSAVTSITVLLPIAPAFSRLSPHADPIFRISA